MLIIITCGLYIVYKKLVKKEALFDRYAFINEKIIASTDSQIRKLRTKYGADQKIAAYINERIAERDGIIAKRQNADAVSAGVTFIIIGCIAAFITYCASLPPKPENSKTATERYIKEGKISKAKKSLAKVEEDFDKTNLTIKIRDMEIDSLTKAGDYNGALTLAKQIEDTNEISHEMESKVDEIIEKEINELVEKNEFTKAKERADLASIPKKEYFLTSIKISESLYNQEQEKNKPKRKKSRR